MEWEQGREIKIPQEEREREIMVFFLLRLCVPATNERAVR